MSYEIDERLGLQRTSDGVNFYIERDAVNDKFRVVVVQNIGEYRSNTGTIVYEVINVTSQKTINTVPKENRGSPYDHNLIIQSGGRSFIEQTLPLGLRSVSDQRVGITQRGDADDLPTIQPGSVLEGVKRREVEVFAGFFSPANAVGRNFDAPSTRKGKIGGVGVLKYPLDIDTNIQDFLQIAIFGYKPGGIPGVTQGRDQSRFARQRVEVPREIIQIPIPNAIADQNAIMWGGGEMTSSSGEAAIAVAGALFGEGDDPRKKIGELAGGLAQAAERTIFGKDPFIRRRKLAGLIASGLAGAGVNIDVNQAITRIGGVIENPNLELLFTGPSLRTFDFTIRFTPRNDIESARVRTIIRVLKERSAVKKGVTVAGLVSASSKNLLLGTPDVFRLQYRKAGSLGLGAGSDIKGLNKFKTCALTNIKVDYTGGEGRYAAYSLDSQPITTVVTLAFSELVPLYDQDYGEKFFPDDDNVGF